MSAKARGCRVHLDGGTVCQLAMMKDPSVIEQEHSMRIRVKITVQKEAHMSCKPMRRSCTGCSVQRPAADHGGRVSDCKPAVRRLSEAADSVSVRMPLCCRSFTPHAYNAIVQVRQKVPHRRTFCYLEQLILKSDAHAKEQTSVKQAKQCQPR